MAPVVLIIPGSGPTNRDGNSPLGVKASTYKLLAEGLAARGIATIRIDKRGMFGSARPVAMQTRSPSRIMRQTCAPGSTPFARRRVRHASGFSAIAKAGVVALASNPNAGDICGLILVATAGRPMGEVIRDQLKSIPQTRPSSARRFPQSTRSKPGGMSMCP